MKKLLTIIVVMLFVASLSLAVIGCKKSEEAANKVKDVANKATAKVYDATKETVSKVKDDTKEAANKVKEAAEELKSNITRPVKDAKENVSKLNDSIKKDENEVVGQFGHKIISLQYYQFSLR